MREVSAKLDQERPKLDHVGAKMATWCSTWGLLGGSGVDFWSILKSCLESLLEASTAALYHSKRPL